MKAVDIHQGLENTLLILQHRLNTPVDDKQIKIEKNYGKLPLLNCYPGQLNQVFFNIITNAINVFTIFEFQKHPEIRITTEISNPKTVKICIADNGLGMSESVRKKVFDPFFTISHRL